MLNAITELTSFEGHTFYATEVVPNEVVGLPFKLLQRVFPRCIRVGIKRARGRVLLKPSPGTTVQEGERRGGGAMPFTLNFSSCRFRRRACSDI